MNSLDPSVMEDWQICEAAEDNMKSIQELAGDLGLNSDELLPFGNHVGKIDYAKISKRLESGTLGKYVNVTAITPTPLGEGKTTTTMGLVQGLSAIGKKVIGAIRQPSGGPTFNVKGSAAGGGLAQCIPLTQLSLGLTGDIDSITNAHNLSLVALTSRMQHESNYGDKTLSRKKLRRLNIDPNNISFKWAIDFSAQALREIVIGLGGKMNGVTMQSGFQIAVSSELMAILSVARDLADLRDRISRIIVAYSKQGEEITTADLEVDGAMAAIMARTINPNLMQTIEGQPVLVHAGPFANIAIGQSSIIADQIGLKLSDYLVTESGFGSDIGFEKFWNLKCRLSGLIPNCTVIVCTIRALKMHGGGPRVVPGAKLHPAYTEANYSLVEQGLSNLMGHLSIVTKSGVNPVVCINHFSSDDPEEVKIVKKAVEALGVVCVVSQHWKYGGEGACELADAVTEACEKKGQFKFLYTNQLPLSKRIETIASEVYGAESTTYNSGVLDKIRVIENNPLSEDLGTCMVKTHLSLSHIPSLKGRPKGWKLPISDVLIYRGAGFAVPVAGDIKLMPGTSSDPAFRRIDIDTDSGKVRGLH